MNVKNIKKEYDNLCGGLLDTILDSLDGRVMEKVFKDRDESLMEEFSGENFDKIKNTIDKTLHKFIKRGKYFDGVNLQIAIVETVTTGFAEIGDKSMVTLTTELRNILAENAGAFRELDRLYAERMKAEGEEAVAGYEQIEAGRKFGRMGN